MRQLPNIVVSILLAASLCACTALKPDSETHREKSSRAMMRACTLLMGDYNKSKHQRALRELKIACREMRLAKEAMVKECEFTRRVSDEMWEQMASSNPKLTRQERAEFRRNIQSTNNKLAELEAMALEQLDETIRSLEQDISRWERTATHAPAFQRQSISKKR